MRSEPYAVEVRWAPAQEMLISLGTYLSYPEQKLLDLGAAWRRDARRKLPEAFAARLDGLSAAKGQAGGDERETAAGACMVRGMLSLLAWAAPVDLSAPEFTAWAGRLPLSGLLDIASESLGSSAEVPANLASIRDEAVELLQGWFEGYFTFVDPAILEGLRQDAQAKELLIRQIPSRELVETASCGVVLDAPPEIETVVLIPQYHSRPWNVFSTMGAKLLLHYPAEAWPPAPGQPSTRLLRLARALDDGNRLRILAFLAGGTRTFGAIAGHLRLAKSTVHHHMVVLRAAGLVRVFTRYSQYLGDRYALRYEALAELGFELEQFIRAGGSQ